MNKSSLGYHSGLYTNKVINYNFKYFSVVEAMKAKVLEAHQSHGVALAIR